jgi:hypothetical protein
MDEKNKPFVAMAMGALVFAVLTAGFLRGETIVVKSPPYANGYALKNSKSYMVNWTADFALTGHVRIELRNANSTATMLTVAASYPNTGRYRWTIPTNVAAGAYHIRVTFLSGGLYDDSDPFSIMPWFLITTPECGPGGNWMRGKTYVITWSAVGPMPDTAQLSMRNVETNAVSIIAESVPNSGSYSWKVPMHFPLGDYNLMFLFKNTLTAACSGRIKIIPALVLMPDSISKTK